MYDNSQLQAFKDCPERYRLKYVEGLRKRESGIEDHHREFGSAIHKALEAHYKGSAQAEVIQSFKDAYPFQIDADDMAKTSESGELLLAAYVQRYAEEDKQDETLAVEVVDTFPLEPHKDGCPSRESRDDKACDCGVPLFTVKIDRILRKQGNVYWQDHKTTGKSFSWTYWKQFEPNPQATAYTAYCIYKFGECSGGIINALRFGHRQRAYKGEPAGFYQEFQRQVINRNPQQVAAWVEDTLRWIRDVTTDKCAPLGVSWKKNEGQCMWCSFAEVCISVNDAQVIEQLYEKGDPNDYLKDGTAEKELTA